jgi:putative ATPase
LAPPQNPSFEVIPALLSRCQVYILNAFTKDLESLLERMKTDRYLSTKILFWRDRSAIETFWWGRT